MAPIWILSGFNEIVVSILSGYLIHLRPLALYSTQDEALPIFSNGS